MTEESPPSRSRSWSCRHRWVTGYVAVAVTIDLGINALQVWGWL